jgi:hypothetical protein
MTWAKESFNPILSTEVTKFELKATDNAILIENFDYKVLVAIACLALACHHDNVMMLS